MLGGMDPFPVDAVTAVWEGVGFPAPLTGYGTAGTRFASKGGRTLAQAR